MIRAKTEFPSGKCERKRPRRSAAKAGFLVFLSWAVFLFPALGPTWRPALAQPPEPEPAAALQQALVVSLVKGAAMAGIQARLYVDGVDAGEMAAPAEAGQESGAWRTCRLFPAPARPYELKVSLRNQGGNTVQVGFTHKLSLEGRPHTVDYVIISGEGDPGRDTAAVRAFQVSEPAASLLREKAESGQCAAWEDIRDHARNYARQDAQASDSLKAIQDLAEQGDSASQLQLARLYSQGSGVPKDKEKALKWAQSAADGGYAEARFFLALAYVQGILTERDYPQASKWAAKAADQGLPGAMVLLGALYRDGLGVSKDPKASFSWYLKAAEKGHIQAMGIVADAYQGGAGVEKSLEKAFEWRLRAAYGGSPAAANNVGQMYYAGQGTAQDYEKALTWLRWAAERGNGNACATMGLMHHAGTGVEQDYAKAAEWFSRGAEKGNAQCMNNLGNYYMAGLGVEKSPELAKEWLRRAAERGHVMAQNKMASLCLQEKDVKQAWTWAAASAQAGDPEGLFLLGVILHGAGDDAQAGKVLELSAKKGWEPAARLLEKIQAQPSEEGEAPSIK